ncbi:hypothetical protein Tco_0011448 [Tanacetum coccineum]
MNRSDIQKNLYNTLIESYNSENDLFASYGDVVTLKRGRDDQDKDKEPSARSNRGRKRRRSDKEESSKEATQKESKSTSSSKGASRSQPKSSGKSAQAEEHGPRVDDFEEPLHQEFNTGNDDVSPAKEMPQLAQASGIQSSFDEFLATPIDFSAFMMNRLKIDNLTQDVLIGPTYNLVKGMCKSVVELEYHLEEVFKATYDQLDWNNPEGRSFREGDFKRHHRQDIEDMLLLLVQEHAEFDESDTHVLERLNTSAGNHVKEILLKLNLPDHKSILTDSKGYLKMEVKSTKVMAFMCTTLTSSYPLTNNHLETSSNPMNQVDMKGQQTQSYVEKMLLAQVQEAGIALSKEQLVILADTGDRVDSLLGAYSLTTNPIFQPDGIDLYDSDCDDISTAKAVLMVNLLSYGSDVLSEVPHSETYQNDMANQKQDLMILSVIEQMSEQMINHVNNWEKANQEKNNESLTAELERYKERVKNFEQRLSIDLSTHEKMIDSLMDDMIKGKLALKQQIDSLEQNLSNQIKEKESLLQTFTKAQQIKPTLYDGSVICSQHVVIHVIDDEETLILEEVSRSKMLAKQNDPISKEKETNTTPINYVELNRLFEDFVKDFKNGLLNELNEVKTIFNQMEAAVDQCSIDKKLFEIEKKELKLENERLLEYTICQDIVNIVMHVDDKSVNVLPVQNTFLDDNIALDVMKMEKWSFNAATLIALAVLKLDLEPLSPKLKNNKEAHVDYIRIIKENADTLRDIVKQARTTNPLDNALTYACMYTKQIQELLVYVSDTCPSSPSRRDIKEILRDITQRDIKEILGNTTQIDIKKILVISTQIDIKEILGDTTQIDIEEILGDTTQIDIEEILGDTTQMDIKEILGDTTQIDIKEILGGYTKSYLSDELG